MADVPRERLAFRSLPFSNTGIDYFGPFYVSITRWMEKHWGYPFTCLATRAVHFEVVLSMATKSCVVAIERNVARCGALALFGLTMALTSLQLKKNS